MGAAGSAQRDEGTAGSAQRDEGTAGGAQRDAGSGAADGERDRELAGGGSMPAFVPERFAPAISRAAQRWNVSATLLAAQLYRESTFDPFAVSGAGAQGIAQFMPATAAGYRLRNRSTPTQRSTRRRT